MKMAMCSVRNKKLYLQSEEGYFFSEIKLSALLYLTDIAIWDHLAPGGSLLHFMIPISDVKSNYGTYLFSSIANTRPRHRVCLS